MRVLADGVDSPTYIAVDANNVYWASSSTAPPSPIMSVPIGGGPVAPAVAGFAGMIAQGVAVAAGRIYFTFVQDLPGKPPLSGLIVVFSLGPTASFGKEVWVELGARALRGPAASASNIYWSDVNAGVVLAMPLDGSAVRTVATGEAQPGPLAVDANNVYWESSAGIRMMPLVGGPIVTLGKILPPPPLPLETALAVDSRGVYMFPKYASCVPWRTPFDGSPSGPVTNAGGTCPPVPGLGIATDGLSVFWTIPYFTFPGDVGNIPPPDKSGAVERAEYFAQGAVDIAFDQKTPWAVTVDSQFVYWTNHGGINGGQGAIMMAPKN